MKHRYPLEPLLKATGLTKTGFARSQGISGGSICEAATNGLSEKLADRWAVRAGLDPYNVWPEMVDHLVAEAEEAEREREQRALERKRARQRRYAARRRQDPDFRARHAAYLAEYRASYRDSLNAQRRRRYEQNRDAELARQAQYDATVRRARRAERREGAA